MGVMQPITSSVSALKAINAQQNTQNCVSKSRGLYFQVTNQIELCIIFYLIDFRDLYGDPSKLSTEECSWSNNG